MKWTAVLGGLVLISALLVLAQHPRLFRDWNSGPATIASSESEKKILGVLTDLRRTGGVYLEVPDSDGRLLRLLTEAAGAQNVVEIGTSTGYSGLWLCMALQNTGGRLTTFEIDHDRAAQARRHFDQAGVGGRVTIVEGDARQTIRQLKSPIDVVFLDADKDHYAEYLTTLLPLIRPGGLILAHNIDAAPDYKRAVTSNAGLETVFYRQGSGMGVTLKKQESSSS